MGNKSQKTFGLAEECASLQSKINRAQRISSAAASAADLIYQGVCARRSVVSFENLSDDEKSRIFGEYDYMLVEIEEYLGGLQDQFMNVDEGISGGKCLLELLKEQKLV